MREIYAVKAALQAQSNEGVDWARRWLFWAAHHDSRFLEAHDALWEWECWWEDHRHGLPWDYVSQDFLPSSRGAKDEALAILEEIEAGRLR